MSSKLLLVFIFIVEVLMHHTSLGAAKSSEIYQNQSGRWQSLTKQIEEVVNIVQSIRLTNDNPPWVIMHGLYAFGPELMVFDKESGRNIKAIDWICNEGASKYFMLKEGNFSTVAKIPSSPNFRIEDHPDQWLFIFSHVPVPSSQEIKLDNRVYSVNDLLESSKREASSYSELTWTIPAYYNYELSKSRWTNKFGEKMDMEHLSELYLKSDWRESACGGAHGLYALANIKRAKILKNKSARELNKILNEALQKAKETQTENGSWATEWYNNKQEIQFAFEDIHITGHQLEWISLAVSRQELNAPWIEEAVLFLIGRLSRMENSDSRTFKFDEHPEFYGFICHAVHGLKIYRERLTD